MEAARDALKPYYALYIGGMGARGTNFYNALFARYGYEAEAQRDPGRCTSTGSQRDAAAAVPDAFVDEVGARRAAGADRATGSRPSATRARRRCSLSTRQPEALRAVAELAL